MSITHGELVKNLAKSGADIRDDMNPKKFEYLLECIEQGVAAGHKIDRAKKQAIYCKDMGLTPRWLPRDITPTAEQYHLIHMAVGIFGEAAELLDAVYQHVAGLEELNVENVIEELGDTEFYIEGFRQGLLVEGVPLERETTLKHNITKLSKRYHGGSYSNQQAQDRADKS